MDTKLVETFLEIVAMGTFIDAAARLNVAQTTVSARIRTLEDQLERPLFTRHKGGATLTPAGEQFLRYAPNFVQLAQRMRRQVAVPAGHQSLLTIGGEVSLWQPLVHDWTSLLRRQRPDIALRVHIDVPQDLINQVAGGLVDIAVMYAPPHRHGLRVDLLMDETLVMATTDPRADPLGDRWFVAADWGSDFSQELESSFPDLEIPALSFNLGWLALDYVLANGGSGYFRRHAIETHLASGSLHLVPDAPQFSYPIYAVSSSDIDRDLFVSVLSSLREIASAPGRE